MKRERPRRFSDAADPPSSTSPPVASGVAKVNASGRRCCFVDFHVMRFDPQSNFLPRDSAPEIEEAWPSAPPRRSFRLPLVVGIGAVAVVGSLFWIARTHGLGPSEAMAYSSDVVVPAPPAETAAADPADATVAPQAPAAEAEQPERPELSEAARHAAGAKALAEGRSAMARGRAADAVAILQEARRIDPGSAAIHYSLGLAYVRTGDFQAARQEMVALKELDPSLANLLGNLVR
jgi:tetratricopeptide (TPR) repeat protein